MLDSVKLRGVNRVQETARMFWIQVWEEEDGRRLIEQSSVLPQLSAGAPVLRWSSTDTSSPAASYCLTVRGAWALPRRLEPRWSSTDASSSVLPQLSTVQWKTIPVLCQPTHATNFTFIASKKHSRLKHQFRPSD